jgi:hypothetical protein
LFRQIFAIGKGGKDWPFFQSKLFLDFLAGNRTYQCTPWGNPTRTVFGWQRPCYLLGEGYAASFKELMEETNWDSYGTGKYEKCANCMSIAASRQHWPRMGDFRADLARRHCPKALKYRHAG